MRRLLGTIGLVILLTTLATACGGDDGGGPVEARDETSPTDPSRPPDGVTYAGKRVVAIVHQTAAGGTVEPEAVPIGTETEREEFVAQFRTPGLREQILSLLDATLSDPYAAVISIGCDVPPGAEVEVDDDGRYLVSPHKVPDPLPECLAPVTSVAILASA